MSAPQVRRETISHPSKSTRVSINAPHRGGRELPNIETWYQGENTDHDAPHFLTLADCVRLRDSGQGRFINHRKGFRRYDRSTADKDQKNYQPSSRRGESLKIDEPTDEHVGIMSRFAMGERYAVVAVRSWATLKQKVSSRKRRKGVSDEARANYGTFDGRTHSARRNTSRDPQPNVE